jgi:membrane protease YdiL (CAAX protease family)
MRRFEIWTLCCLFVGWVVPARAETPSSMRAEVDSYYGGEATAAYLVLGFGVAQLAGGAALVTRSSDFARGLGWPLLSLGALELVGAIVYAIEVASQLDHYRTLLANDPQSFQTEELEHIRGTTSRFAIYRAAEIGLTAIGVAFTVAGALSEESLFTGMGIGIAAAAFPIFVIDTFNYRRAGAYQERLGSFRPVISARDDRLTVGFGGTF